MPKLNDHRLENGGRPSRKYRYFWVGCPDDAFLETAVPDEKRPETFVHTSLGNHMPPTDIGPLSALEWVINTHSIERIVICGHYHCRAIEFAAKGAAGEIAGHWLSPLKKIVRHHDEWLSKLPSPQRLASLCELNTIYQALSASKSAAVQAAWRRKLSISLTAVVNDLSTGLLQDLNFVLTAESDVGHEFERAIAAVRDRSQI